MFTISLLSTNIHCAINLKDLLIKSTARHRTGASSKLHGRKTWMDPIIAPSGSASLLPYTGPFAVRTMLDTG